MVSESEVKDLTTEISAHTPNKRQFGTGPQYRRNHKWSKWLTYLSGILFVVPFTWILIKGVPKRKVPLSDFLKVSVSSEQTSHDFGSEIDLSTASDIKRSPKRSRQVTVIKFSGPQAISRPRISKVIPGVQAQATLLTTGGNGLVKVRLLEPVAFNGDELIEVGSILIGTGQSTEDRLFVQFNQIVFPNGDVDSIQAQAVDIKDQSMGLRGKTVWRQAVKLGAAVGLYFVAGLSEGLQQKEVHGDQVITKPTAKNALLNGAKTASLELSQEKMNELKNSPVQIEVKAGTRLYVVFF